MSDFEKAKVNVSVKRHATRFQSGAISRIDVRKLLCSPEKQHRKSNDTLSDSTASHVKRQKVANQNKLLTKNSDAGNETAIFVKSGRKTAATVSNSYRNSMCEKVRNESEGITNEGIELVETEPSGTKFKNNSSQLNGGDPEVKFSKCNQILPKMEAETNLSHRSQQDMENLPFRTNHKRSEKSQEFECVREVKVQCNAYDNSQEQIDNCSYRIASEEISCHSNEGIQEVVNCHMNECVLEEVICNTDECVEEEVICHTDECVEEEVICHSDECVQEEMSISLNDYDKRNIENIIPSICDMAGKGEIVIESSVSQLNESSEDFGVSDVFMSSIDMTTEVPQKNSNPCVSKPQTIPKFTSYAGESKLTLSKTSPTSIKNLLNVCRLLEMKQGRLVPVNNETKNLPTSCKTQMVVQLGNMEGAAACEDECDIEVEDNDDLSVNSESTDDQDEIPMELIKTNVMVKSSDLSVDSIPLSYSNKQIKPQLPVMGVGMVEPSKIDNSDRENSKGPGFVQISLDEVNLNVKKSVPQVVTIDSMSSLNSNKRNFKCSRCRQRFFSTQNELELHMRCHNAGGGFCCVECGYSAPQWNRVLEHMMGHDSLKEQYMYSPFAKNLLGNFQCSECDKCFERKSSIRAHVMKVHMKPTRECHICQQVIKNKDEKTFRRHVEKCEGLLYKCNLCDYTSYCSLNMKKHLRIHSVSALTCATCDAKFPTRQQLKVHEQIHNSNRDRPQCPLCCMSFSSKDSLKRHCMRSHTETNVLHKCPYCNYMTKLELDVRKHISLVHFKKFSCKQCSYSTNLESALKEHYKFHEPDRLYHCSVAGCYFSAVQAKSLSSHINQVHRQSASFVCQICKRAYKQRTHLLRHMVTHSKDKAYYCKECGAEFRNHASYYKHRREMQHDLKREGAVSIPHKMTLNVNDHGDRKSTISSVSYECPFCKVVLVSSDLLKKHLDEFHSLVDALKIDSSNETLESTLVSTNCEIEETVEEDGQTYEIFETDNVSATNYLIIKSEPNDCNLSQETKEVSSQQSMEYTLLPASAQVEQIVD